MEQKYFDLKEIIPALSLIIDHQATGNLFHSFRVAIIAYLTSEKAGFWQKDAVFYEGLLHDIGLFETGEHILPDYTDIASQISNQAILNHPAIGAKIVKEIPGIPGADSAILEHHEYFNGSGYPSGKKKKEILQEAQYLRLADSFDLFIRKIPKINHADIVSFAESGSGKEFSPETAFCFLGIDKHVLLSICQEEGLKSYFSELSSRIQSPKAVITDDIKESLLKVLGRAIDGKHRYTNEHSLRVSFYALRIAKRMGLPKDTCRKIKLAGYLHDIGKIAIPNSILNKPGPLNSEELSTIKTHAEISYQIVKSVSYFRDFAELVFASQEEFDGSGYPRSLRGEEIPLGARIISVADAIDAMLSDRAYRKALPRENTVKEITQKSGSQFDPEVVRTVLKLL